MDFRMQAITKAGHKFVELAEEHGKEAAAQAERHDREGSFPTEVFESMKASGFLAAAVPEEFGGLGLESAHDLATGLTRLGYGDGSTSIATNMHLSFGLIGTRMLHGAREVGDDETRTRMEGYLSLLGGGAIGMANATEAGTDLLHPLVEAAPVEGGFALNGRKIFGTLSPVADLFFVTLKISSSDGEPGSGFAIVPRGTPGQNILANWDAVGMRASGSNDVVYEDCVVPEAFVTTGGPWGEDNELNILIGTAGNIGLPASFLGIAEAARDQVVEMVRTRTKAPSGRPIAERYGIQHQVAEMEADLATARALLDRTGRLMDHHLFERPVSEVSLEELHQLHGDFQCAKLVVNRKAIEIVDRALTLSGGAGYLTASPLSRLYRDVRAGPFMQPYSPNEAYGYIGKVALGLPPTLEG
jgi:L-evernosamine nitrososynthase